MWKAVGAPDRSVLAKFAFEERRSIILPAQRLPRHASYSIARLAALAVALQRAQIECATSVWLPLSCIAAPP